MLKVNRSSNARDIVNSLGVIPVIEIVNEAAEIAFEMSIINRVKMYKCCEETDIHFGETFAHQPIILTKEIFMFIQRSKESLRLFFINFLRSSKACLVIPMILG